MKNLMAASFDLGSLFRNPARTNAGADTSSSEMNSINRSREEAMVSMPRNDDSSRK